MCSSKVLNSPTVPLVPLLVLLFLKVSSADVHYKCEGKSSTACDSFCVKLLDSTCDPDFRIKCQKQLGELERTWECQYGHHVQDCDLTSGTNLTSCDARIELIEVFDNDCELEIMSFVGESCGATVQCHTNASCNEED